MCRYVKCHKHKEHENVLYSQRHTRNVESFRLIEGDFQVFMFTDMLSSSESYSISPKFHRLLDDYQKVR